MTTPPIVSVIWSVSRVKSLLSVLSGLEIRQTALVRATPKLVYDGVTTAQGLVGWYTVGASVGKRP
jgi:hypothetical protein